MDTPDKAAGLADTPLADAINKEWLLASADGISRRELGSRWLTRSSSVNNDEFYCHHDHRRQCQAARREEQFHNKSMTSAAHDGTQCHEDESAHLLWPCTGGKQQHCQSYKTKTNYGTRTLLYDNISFVDSSPLIRSLTLAKSPLSVAPLVSGASFGKFRIILACYLLIGITLAIYSRNALSLAAIEMVASNKVSKELADVLATSSGANNVTGKIHEVAFENSCPLVSTPEAQTKRRSPANNLSKEQAIEYMSSIKRRIEEGKLVDWTPGEQGLIFASGSVGNLLFAIPLTRLGEIYGPKWIIFIALVGTTIQAALMPLVSGARVVLVILFQVVFNGLTFGADCVAYTLFAHWLTPTEMAFFVSSLLVCYQLGAIISNAITAKLLIEGVAWSWCFYTPAILCALWTVIWALIGASEPAKSWLISDRELEFLQKSSKISQLLKEDDDYLSPETPTKNGLDSRSRAGGPHSVSWFKLARDPNIWAIVAVKFSLRWYFSVNISLMPTYLSSVAHMSISTIGKINVFQSFTGLISGLLMSYLTRSIVSKRPLDLQLPTVRKIFQSIVNFGLASSLLAFMTFDCSQWVTIVSLAVSGICVNFYVAAGLQLPLDLSPDHCGLITSISNTLAIGQSLGAPISGLILNHGPRDRSLWRIVWGIAVLLNTLSGLLFIFLVDSKPGDYNLYKSRKTVPREDEERQQH